MSADDDLSFEDEESDTALEHDPYDDRTAFGTSFDEQLALREAVERAVEQQEAEAPAEQEEVGAKEPASPTQRKNLAFASTARGPSFDERISQMGQKIAAMPLTDTPIAGVARPKKPFPVKPGARTQPAPFPAAKLATPIAAQPRPATPATPEAGGAAAPRGHAPTSPAPFGAQPQPAAPPPTAPEPNPMPQDKQPLEDEEEGGALPKTVMLNPEDWGPSPPQPASSGPLSPTPFGAQPQTMGTQPPVSQPAGSEPVNPAPFGAQPQSTGTQPPVVAQPYAPISGPAATPGTARPKRRSNLVVFALSAVAVFLISGVCVGGAVLYLLFNRY